MSGMSPAQYGPHRLIIANYEKTLLSTIFQPFHWCGNKYYVLHNPEIWSQNVYRKILVSDAVPKYHLTLCVFLMHIHVIVIIFKEPALIFLIFSNFLTFRYQMKAKIFLTFHMKFYSWNMFSLVDTLGANTINFGNRL